MPNDLFRGQFDKAPHAWQLVPLKMLMNVESGREVIVEVHEGENAVPVYGSGLFPFKFTDRSISSRRAIVFGRKGTIGQPYLVSPPYWLVDTAYSAIPKKGVVLQYLYFLLSVFDWQPFVTNTAKPSLVANDILAEKVPCPSVIEQEKIVEFLESKTAKIDALIEKLSLQVELLERYRRELIARTVTRGLDPDVPMKDSGVDWIGSMPRTWSTIPVRRLFEVVKRVEPGFSDQVLSITQRGIVPKDLSSHFGQIAESYDSYQRVDVGDYAMNAMDLLTGWVDRSKYQGITSPDYRVFRLRPQSGADPRYFTHVLQMGYTRRIFYRFGQGVSNLGRWRLQPKVFLSMRFPLPPLDEQVAIADHIEGKHAEIDSTIEGINRQIELLGKYRKQVINDAVTGKVRVGEVA